MYELEFIPLKGGYITDKEPSIWILHESKELILNDIYKNFRK